MTGRRVLVGVGVAAAAAGVALTLRPGLVSGGFLTSAFVVGVWAVAFGGAAYAGFVRLTASGVDDGGLPNASERPDCPVPGDDVGERVAAVGASDRDAAERDVIRDRVRRAAVATLVRERGLTPAAARRRLAGSTWTDDPEAARLFDRDTRHEGVESDFDVRFASAVDALARLSFDDRTADGESSTADDGGERA